MAAHADEVVTPSEHDTIRALLCEVLETDELPKEVEERLASFDPSDFDPHRAAEAFEAKPSLTHRQLLELVRAVCEADGILELSEDGYMVALLLALRGQPDEHPDLILRDPFAGRNKVIKRAEDLLVAACALGVVAAPMLAIAFAIKLDSAGPVFFRQQRYGVGGEPIRVWKFRTMTCCEDGTTVVQAKKNDARVTRVGAFLRRTSLDELPQIFNVLGGTMSLVGPRPHAVAHNEKYRRLIGQYMLRHKVLPGITGWAQVNGFRGETDTLDKMVRRVEHDLEYIEKWSLALDLKCLWLTAFGRKVRSGAY
jgi:putative colanic acid biosynthesis UDP-glucose lipid carrier transferase